MIHETSLGDELREVRIDLKNPTTILTDAAGGWRGSRGQGPREQGCEGARERCAMPRLGEQGSGRTGWTYTSRQNLHPNVGCRT